MFGWFKRKPRPAPRPPINEDWRVGDLAECVVAGSWEGGYPGPDVGDILQVQGVRPGFDRSGDASWGLKLLGWEKWFDAFAFRKLILTHEPAEQSFTDLIRRVAKPRTPEPVSSAEYWKRMEDEMIAAMEGRRG